MPNDLIASVYISMDHLPKVEQPFPQETYNLVPCLCCDLEYDANPLGYEGFSHFPSRWGYTLGSLEHGDLGGRHIDDAAGFLQAWLFFGLLTEVLGGIGVPFRQSDFLREGNGGAPIITTEPLPLYLWYWLAAHTHSGRDVVRAHERHVQSCLRLSNTILQAITKLHIKSNRNVFTCKRYTQAVILSLIICGETLNKARDWIGNTRIKPALRWHFPPLSLALLDAGWCTGQIPELLKERDSSTLLYLSRLDMHIPKKDHRRCNAKLGCRANHINYATYDTKHAADCQIANCQSIGPPMQEISEILNDGDIPLIAMDFSCEPSQLMVVRYKEITEYCNDYIAISHVWSDGLGNPYANSLPRCQLDRIQHQVNQLWDPAIYVIPFWIDTLCVPLHKELRDLAIQRMYKTYISAYGVLVFDNSFQHVSGKVSKTEAVIRIVYSTWMTRLWTFQEGRLSHRLWFQFKDEALYSEEFFGCNLRPTSEDVSALLLQEDRTVIRSHPNAMQLARALACEQHAARQSMEYYASLPKQEDPKKEAVRLLSVDELNRQAGNPKLASIWKPIVASIDHGLTLSAVDKDLHGRLFHPSFCTVTSHAGAAFLRMKGVGTEQYLGQLGPSAEEPGLRPSEQLINMCWGLRGRSTSRLEDETICLSALLGLDVARVQQISPLHWRLKESLIKMRELLLYIHWITLEPRARILTVCIGKFLRSTLEERMKIVLSQIEYFPKQMIFWNTPRLQLDGWRWAPSSFLHRDFHMPYFKSGFRSYLSNDGLLVQSPALRVRKALISEPSLAPRSTSEKSEILFVIHQLSNVYNINPRIWQGPHLRLVTRQLNPAVSLVESIHNKKIDEIALLLEPISGSQMDDGERNDFVMVSIYKEDSKITYVRHIAVLEGHTQSPGQNRVHILVDCIPKRTWCIG